MQETYYLTPPMPYPQDVSFWNYDESYLDKSTQPLLFSSLNDYNLLLNESSTLQASFDFLDDPLLANSAAMHPLSLSSSPSGSSEINCYHDTEWNKSTARESESEEEQEKKMKKRGKRRRNSSVPTLSKHKMNSTRCSNCHTANTPLWRRNPQGLPLCNACGLFYKLHGTVRPLSLKTDVIKKRNRNSHKEDKARTRRSKCQDIESSSSCSDEDYSLKDLYNPPHYYPMPDQLYLL